MSPKTFWKYFGIYRNIWEQILRFLQLFFPQFHVVFVSITCCQVMVLYCWIGLAWIPLFDIVFYIGPWFCWDFAVLYWFFWTLLVWFGFPEFTSLVHSSSGLTLVLSSLLILFESGGFGQWLFILMYLTISLFAF